MQPSSSSAPAVEFAQKSDPGRDPEKQVNEDACGYRATRFGHLCVVCDGMGGHAGGREASHLALQTIFDRFDLAPAGTRPAEVLRDAIAEANRRVSALATADRASARPGSTAVAILTHEGGTEVAHVGDSRCYVVHEGQIAQVTKDHSMVQQLVDAGLLTPAQAAVHPNANQITRALGMAPEIEVDVRAAPVQHVAGDAFVLCSDGLSDLVQASEVLEIVGSQPAAQAAGMLVDLANARGGHDNITVQILRTKESAATPRSELAPTLAQTVPEDHPSGRITEPGGIPVAHAMIPPALGSAPSVPSMPSAGAAPSLDARHALHTAPPRHATVAARKRWVAVTVFGIVLALIGIGAVIAVMINHVSDLGGKRKWTAPEGGEIATPADAGPEAAAPAPTGSN